MSLWRNMTQQAWHLNGHSPTCACSWVASYMTSHEVACCCYPISQAWMIFHQHGFICVASDHHVYCMLHHVSHTWINFYQCGFVCVASDRCMYCMLYNISHLNDLSPVGFVRFAPPWWQSQAAHLHPHRWF